MDSFLVGIIISFSICFFLLYTRNRNWANQRLRWVLCTILFLLGLIGFGAFQSNYNSNYVFFWHLCIPLLYFSLDRLFKAISFYIYNRDFFLWLRHSDEINDSLGAKNSHVKAFDIVFSLFLLVWIVSLALFGSLLFK